MRLLLDTHALLWFINDDPKLSAVAKTEIVNPSNDCYVSVASLIEIAVKVRLAKLHLNAPFAALFPAELTSNDIHLQPVEIVHIERLTTMALHHRDPFDRLIAATALVEGFTVVSIDGIFNVYGVPRLW